MRRLCWLIFCFCMPLHALPQPERLRFEHLGIEDGLSNDNVTAIVQDKQGFIWLGTLSGLNKYDGYSFTQYEFDPFDSTTVSQNVIYCLFEDSEGTIWVGTSDGLSRFIRGTETFKRYKPSIKAKFSDPNISAIGEDASGTLWVGNFTGQLCRFDKEKGTFVDEMVKLGDYKVIAQHDLISAIVKGQNDDLWVGSGTGLHHISFDKSKAGKLLSIKSVADYIVNPATPSSFSNTIWSIARDKSGILWVSTLNGLNSFDPKTKRFRPYRHDPNDPHSISSDSLGVWISGMAVDAHDNLWVGTDKGLNMLNKERTRFTRYHADPNDPNSLSTNFITSVFIDAGNVLWVASAVNRLNVTDLNHSPFGIVRHDPNSNSLSNNQVTSMFEDPAGIVWIGTYGGGLNRWDRKNNQFTIYRNDPANPGSLKDDHILAMLMAKNGDFWVGNGETLSQFNSKTGQFVHYSTHPDGENRQVSSVISITEDHEGFIWIGTGFGIKRFDTKSKTFKSWFYDPKNPDGISDHTAISIFCDSNDDIWIGYGSMGTDRYDKKLDKFFHYKNNSTDSFSISSNVINNFIEDKYGKLWLCTLSGGLCIYDPKSKKFTTYTRHHGLPNNSIHSIVFDNQGFAWLGTGNGLSKFDPASKKFINFGYKDGLQGNKFSAGGMGDLDKGSAFKSKDGTLFFGGPNGLNYFDPTQINPNSPIAPVVITRFKLFDREVKGGQELKEIKLRYNQNYFSFEFASLSYYNPAKNQYRYKLEGFDKDWVNSGSRHYVSYTNLDPGTYTFRVIGTNNDGIWNEKGASVLIVISPPWWRTWWAYSFYALCLLIAAYMVHRYLRRKTIQKERERTKEKELQQAKEIEKAYHELKRTQTQLIHAEKMASLGELTAGIAHEIENPLNFVNNFSEVNAELIDEILKDHKKPDRDLINEESLLNDIKTNTEKISHHGKRADAIVKGMLQHSKGSSGKKEPTDLNVLAEEYLRLAYHGVRARDKTSNVIIKTDFDNTIGKKSLIPDDIARVLLNLYQNAFYAVLEKKKHGLENFEPTVWVTTKNENGKTKISVRDNGAGIPEKIKSKVFQPFFTTKPAGSGTGLGLSLSYEIVKAHGGELSVETVEGEGSEFVVVLP